MFCQELKTELKQTIGVGNEYHEGTKAFEDLGKGKEWAISRVIEVLLLPIEHKDVQRIRKRIIKFNQELFTFLDNPLIEPTNNRAKAAIETQCYYEKDNFWQPFSFRGVQPCGDDEYYSDRHLEWHRALRYFSGFISKAFDFIYGIAQDKVAMN